MARVLAALVLSLPLTACQAVDDADRSDGPPVIGDGEKADGATAIEVVARLGSASPVSGRLTSAAPRVGYVLFAAADSDLRLEVTQQGSAQSLDTVLKLYGPRKSDGSYPPALAEDDDAGHGKLSRLAAAAPADGFYLVEVASKDTPAEPRQFRLALSCSGTCDSDAPIAPLGLDIRWTMRSAEARAARLQAYRRAGERLHEMAGAAQLAGDWGVILDCDETVIDNARYQRERAELGVGYSAPSWITWVERQEASAIPGAADFLSEVRGLGGRVVFVTNRKAQLECAPTVANLDAIGLRADAVLCRTDTSDKNPRFDAVADGTAAANLPPLEVVMWVGDNILDFPGLSQDLRREQDGAFADFGDRFILIPNPMYGSWEKNED